MKTVMVIGADGYIGNAIVQRLLFKKYKVIGIDNFFKRIITDKQMIQSAIPIQKPLERMKKFQEIGDYTFKKIDLAKDIDTINNIIKEYKPDTIINLAHMPSGPWSMKDNTQATYTLMNNIIGTNTILWAIKENNPDCHYITIGSTGEYDHYNNIDIEEGYFSIEWKGRQSTEMIFPRRTASIYHVSKISSTYLIDTLSRMWELKCTDIMQSIVFGLYTDEIIQTKIHSSFFTDESFGTVLNRFICQAKSNTPLTIFGKGDHKRGFISLNDCVQALMIAVENEPKKGKPQVWNQLSEWHSINDIAKMVQVEGNKKGLNVKTTKIKSPRIEKTEDHYYKYVTNILKGYGYKSTRTIPEEINYCLDNINENSFVLPKINWR